MRRSCRWHEGNKGRSHPSTRPRRCAWCRSGIAASARWRRPWTWAKALDLTETALREWVKTAAIDARKGRRARLTTAEREELVRLRRDNKRLEVEREILKKAAAFFAKESR